MARKRKNDLDSWNRSLGYSDEALKALSSGTYDQLTGRDPKYNTSREQTYANQSNIVPALDGMFGQSSSTPAWESSFGRNKRQNSGMGVNIDTQAIRQRLSDAHTPIGKTLSKNDEDVIYKLFDTNRFQFGTGNRENNIKRLTHQLTGNFWNKSKTKDWEEKYGKSLEQIVADYYDNWETTDARRNAEYAENNKVGATLKNIANGIFQEAPLDLMTLGAKGLSKIGVVPDEYYNAYRQASRANKTQKSQLSEGVTKNMSGVGKGAYEFTTDAASRLGRDLSPLGFLMNGAITTENQSQALEDQGVTGTRADIYSLLLGAADAAASKYAKGISGKGNTVIGRAGNSFLKNLVLGTGEQTATEIADKLILGNEATFDRDVKNYVASGLSEEEASDRAWENLAMRVLSRGGLRATIGAASSLTGDALKGVEKKLKDLAYKAYINRYVVDPDDPIFSEPIVNMDDLNEYFYSDNNLPGGDLPRLTGTVENPQALPGSGTVPALPDNIYPIQMPGTNGVINLPGETAPIQLPDLAATSTPTRTMNLAAAPSTIRSSAVTLDELNSKRAAIEKSIRARENNISIYEQDQWRGQVKKASQKKIRQANREIAELKQELKAIDRQIKGEPTPVIEQLEKQDQTSFRNYKTALKKLGDRYGGQDGKDIAENAIQQLDDYIETGSKESLRGFARDMFQIHLMAAGDPEYDFNYGTQDGIFGATFSETRTPIHKAIENVRKFHENKPAVVSESAPIEAPASTPLEIEDADFAKGVASATPDSSFSRMNALFEQANKSEPVTLQSEQTKIDKFLDGKKPDSMTTESGHIFERYSKKDMNTTLKSIKENGYCDDEQVAIIYNDGSYVVYGDGDDTSNMKLTGIKTAIWNNASTSAYSGNGVNIINYDQNTTDPVNADWRVVFEEDYPREAPQVPEVTQAPAPAPKEVPFVYNNFPDSEVPYTKTPEMDEYMLQNNVEPMREAARENVEPHYDPALDEEMRTNYLDPMKEEWNRDALDNLNMEEDIPAQAPDNGYWLRVLGDEEFAVQEAAKQGVDIDDLRKAAAYNTGYDLPKSSDNVPPTNNPPGGNEPPEDEPKMRERGMSKHMRGEGKMQMEGVPDEVKEDFINDPDMYKVLSNKSTQEKADYIYNNADDVEAAFRDLLIKKDPAALPLGHQIAKDYSAAGNYDMAAQIYRDMGEKLTEAGQFSQAAVLAMMREDPMTALHYAQKELSKLNAEGKKRFGDKWKPFELTEDEIDAFNHINPGDTEAIQKVYDQIGQRIGKEYPTTFMEKLLEGRKIAMLFNPRTVARNFLANPPTLAMRWVSDRIEALGQAAYSLFDPSFERTQAITGSGIKGRRLAKEFLESDAGQRLINGTTGKYEVPDIKGAFTKDKQMYKGTAVSKWIDQMTNGGIQRLNEELFDKEGVQSSMETIRNLTYGLLELGDNPFVKENFIERLGSYIHVQGIENVEDIPEAAVELAWAEAMKATYKDNSWAVELLNKTKKGMEAVPVIGRPLSQATIPFVQAPGNISARMVDYSAIRGTKGIADVISGANKGDHDKVRKGIEEMAKGLTGMLGIAAGIALYKSGIITGDYAEKPKQKAFQQLDGFKSWALHVGDKYFKYDWAQPGAEQLIIGTLLAQAIENSDQYDSDVLRYFGVEGSKAGKVIGALGSGVKASVNSWFDQSSLQSLMDLMRGNSGQSTDMAQNIVDVGVSDFAGALVPSVGNATAKTIDTTARQTTDPSNAFATFINQQMAKIPEVSKSLPAKYDVWGEETKYAKNKTEAFLQRFVIPGEYGTESSDPTNKELKRLLDATGDDKVFPFYAAKTVGDKTLNNEEVSAYQKDMGQRSKKLVDAFLKSDQYKTMSDEDRVASLYSLYQTSKLITERDLFDKPVANTSDWKKYVEAYDSAGGGDKGIEAVVNFGKTKSAMKSAGLKGNSNLGKSVEAAAKSGDMKKVEQITNAAQSVEDLGFTKVNPKETYIKAKEINPSLTLEEFGTTYRAIDGADGSKPNQGIRQKEVIDYLNQNEVPYVKGIQIYDMYAPAGKKKAAQKDDGTWYLK